MLNGDLSVCYPIVFPYAITMDVKLFTQNKELMKRWWLGVLAGNCYHSHLWHIYYAHDLMPFLLTATYWFPNNQTNYLCSLVSSRTSHLRMAVTEKPLHCPTTTYWSTIPSQATSTSQYTFIIKLYLLLHYFFSDMLCRCLHHLNEFLCTFTHSTTSHFTLSVLSATPHLMSLPRF